jgi:hypothetical protein
MQIELQEKSDGSFCLIKKSVCYSAGKSLLQFVNYSNKKTGNKAPAFPGIKVMVKYHS